jgi:hypothetical protein
MFCYIHIEYLWKLMGGMGKDVHTWYVILMEDG